MLFVFFFQAEDGIRDLVRSRGLGDVYKRQSEYRSRKLDTAAGAATIGFTPDPTTTRRRHGPAAVSYTHLTLPTSDLV